MIWKQSLWLRFGARKKIICKGRILGAKERKNILPDGGIIQNSTKDMNQYHWKLQGGSNQPEDVEFEEVK